MRISTRAYCEQCGCLLCNTASHVEVTQDTQTKYCSYAIHYVQDVSCYLQNKTKFCAENVKKSVP